MGQNRQPRSSRTPSRRASPAVGLNSGNSGNNTNNILILILTLVFIVVSIISSLVYFDSVSNTKPKVLVNGGKAVGEVTLRILPPPEETGEEASPATVTDSVTGKVILRILP